MLLLSVTKTLTVQARFLRLPVIHPVSPLSPIKDDQTLFCRVFCQGFWTHYIVRWCFLQHRFVRDRHFKKTFLKQHTMSLSLVLSYSRKLYFVGVKLSLIHSFFLIQDGIYSHHHLLHFQTETWRRECRHLKSRDRMEMSWTVGLTLHLIIPVQLSQHYQGLWNAKIYILQILFTESIHFRMNGRNHIFNKSITIICIF